MCAARDTQPTSRDHGEPPILASVDVLVVGGGCAGSVAATAAARRGASVVLLEQHGFLGGTSTGVLDSFYGFYIPGDDHHKVVGGIADEVLARLDRQGHSLRRPDLHGGGVGIGYDPEQLKCVWEGLVLEAGVRLFLHGTAISVELAQDARSQHTIGVYSKGRIYAIQASYLIDATGDANACALANLPFLDRQTADVAQAMTTPFRLANVDTERARSFPRSELGAMLRVARETGRYDLPHDDVHVHRATFPHGAHALMTRVGGLDATDPRELTDAELRGRAQALEYARFLRDRVPGYENAIVVSLGAFIGIRDSRRIVGDVTLSLDDLTSGRRFPDAVARSGSPIEVQAVDGSRWTHLPEGVVYDIPLRALLPAGTDNLLVAGRCISATDEAHASCRLMAQCMAMGEGAGTAAALAAGRRQPVRELEHHVLREALVDQGAILSEEQVPGT